MYKLKKNRKVFTSKFVGTGPSSYEKRIYRAAVSQRLKNTALTQCASSGQATKGHRNLRTPNLQSGHPCNAHCLWSTLPFHIKINTLLMKYSELVSRVL